MRRGRVLFPTVGAIVLSLAQASHCEQQTHASVETSRLEDVEQRLGPFVITGQSFTVVLHEKRLKGPESHLAQTVAALDILDQNGLYVYQKTFPAGVEQGKFKQAIEASARLLVGGGDREDEANSIGRRSGKNAQGRPVSSTGLLIDYRLYTASGGNQEAWQVFGYRDGKLALFDKPTRTDSLIGGPLAIAKVVGPSGATAVRITPRDIFDFRVWTGNFYVMVPVAVDWERGRLGPARRCLGMREPPRLEEIGCPLRVEAERTPQDAEMTFLRLLTGEGPNQGEAKHVVLDNKSRIQFLQASAIIDWRSNGDLMQIGLHDLWLQVLINDRDRKTGWIHTDEDFAAVGLPLRSATP